MTNDPDLHQNGRLAIVTASTSGIGRAVAHSLLENGYSLVVNGRRRESVERVVAELRQLANASERKVWIEGVVADLTEEGVCDRIFEPLHAHGTPLTAAFINTPTPAVGESEALNNDMWNYAFRALIRFPDELIRRAAEEMTRHGGGAIVVNNSCSSTVPIASNFYLANTLRPVAVAQAKAYARRYIGRGVRINVLLTGYVDTALTRGLSQELAAQAHENPADTWASWERSIPIGRLAKPDEIARVATFLLSSESSYVVGVALEVDGGVSMMHQNF